MNRKFVIYCVVFLAVAFAGFQAWDYSKADNINARFTDGSPTFNTVRVTNLYKGGTAVTSTAAELNLIDGSVAGSAVASKALVLGTSKEVDSLLVNGLTCKTPIIQLTVSRTALTSETGKMFYARPIAEKETLTLPGAAAGLLYDVYVADADTLKIKCASGDSLILNSGAAAGVITGTVAGMIRLVALDATRWLMYVTSGTWTSH